MHFRIKITLITLLFCQVLFGQSGSISGNLETGLPLIQNFAPEDYNGVDQNFGLVQDSEGLLYVANRHGLIVYDGLTWSKINNLNCRSIGIDPYNNIYVGGIGELILFIKDSVNKLIHHSLKKHIPEENRNFKRVERTIYTPQGIFFGTQHYLFQWIPQDDPTLGEMKVFYSEENLDPLYLIHGTLYFRRRGLGLSRFTGEGFELVPGGEVLAGSGVRTILLESDSKENGSFVIGTYRHGLFRFDGQNIKPFIPGPNTQKLISEKFILYGETLKNGDWVIQMLPHTVLLTDSQGKLKQVFSKPLGLRDATVLDVLEDSQDGLWFALNDGLARVEMPSPITQFDESLGLGRTINSIIRYKDQMYFGGQSGLYTLKKAKDWDAPSEIKLLTDLTGQTASFLPLESSLLVAGSLETVKISNEKIEKLFSSGVTLFYRSPFDPNIVYVGFSDGLRIYRIDNKTLSGKVVETDQIILTLEEEKPGQLWIGVGNGVIKLELNPLDFNFEKNEEINSVSIQNFEKNDVLGAWNGIFKIDNKIVIGTAKGLRSFLPSSQTFELDSTYGAKFANPTTEIFRLFQFKSGEFWAISYLNKTELQLDRVTLNPEGEYISQSIPFEKVKDLGTIYSIYPDPQNEDVIWFGGTNGVLRYNLSVEEKINTNIAAKVRKVIFRDSSILYGGASLDPTVKKPTIIKDYSTSGIRFEYAIPIFENIDKVEFQYILDGFEDNWSIWTAKTEKEYGNLPEGTYVFRVRAKDRYGNISPEGKISLKILPPWYRTWWAFILFGILIFSFIAITVSSYSKWRMKQLKIKNKELEETVEERTLEIKQKNNQLEDSLNNLQRTQQQLIMQEKMASLGQLTMGIAHEIKNPLNFVNNFALSSVEMADELKEELNSYVSLFSEEDKEAISDLLEDIREHVELIQEQGVRADSIVTSMMNHGNDNQGERTETDVNAMITEQVELAYKGYKGENKQFQVDISQDLASDLPLLNINPQEVGRVIINILNNAFFAVEQKIETIGESFIPEIFIQARVNLDNLEIRIRDNGLGIPQKVQNQIFQPFFTTKATGEGNIGLGLSISYDIITKGHQGTITVDSTEGEFTEFSIFLPLNS